uniref:Beta-galactosidase n=1 Tax=Latimeria chalumnae TaxID=7897 RepID=H3B9D4_LATCH
MRKWIARLRFHMALKRFPCGLRFNWSGLIPAKMMNRKLGLQAETSDFQLEGEVFRILGGSMHYFRVPQEYWRDRMLKMKACGLNTLTTYVAWNLHEPERGLFDFNGNLDLRVPAFLISWAVIGFKAQICMAIYNCAVITLLVFSWLLRDPNMQLRTTYKGFTDAADGFFDNLLSQVVSLQYKKGGPIIAFQVENEYGSYAKDIHYLTYVKEALLKRGVVELLLTSDNKDGLLSGFVIGALATINFQKLQPALFSHLDSIQPGKPKMVMEFWTGWFDQWGSSHHVFEANDMVSTVSEIIQKGMSINLYMFHGGTNFGFLNGALDFDNYVADVTSYDYDAPLSEAGDYTPKYMKLRQLYSKFLDTTFPEPPKIDEKAAYGSIELKQYIPLWEALKYTGTAIQSQKPINMENLPINNGNGQSYGYTLYEVTLPSSGKFISKNNVRDRAQLFLDGRSIGVVDYKTQSLTVPNTQGKRLLSILVENQGRASYGLKLNKQRKGLVGEVFLNNQALSSFSIYSLEMKPSFLERLQGGQWKDVSGGPKLPGFFQGTLIVRSPPRDTYVKLPGWEKGVIFVNGRNLGRYWKVGPQETLYLPGPWLHKGENERECKQDSESGTDAQILYLPRHVYAY